MTFYLYENQNPNAPIRSNGLRFWGQPQRRTPAPQIIVVHTAENLPDFTPPDTGAESIARYFATTSRPVSTQSVTDSDSTIRLLPDEAVAYQVRNYNTISWGIEIATQAAKWRDIPAWHREALMRRAAAECARVATRYDIPVTFLTRAQVDAGVRGFTGHTNLDPTRRTDPGFTPAQWQQFLTYVHEAKGAATMPTPPDLTQPGEVFHDAWAWAEQNGIVNEHTDPVDDVQKQEMIAFLHRYHTKVVEPALAAASLGLTLPFDSQITGNVRLTTPLE